MAAGLLIPTVYWLCAGTTMVRLAKTATVAASRRKPVHTKPVSTLTLELPKRRFAGNCAVQLLSELPAFSILPGLPTCAATWCRCLFSRLT